ncbi:MAG TPA: CBS domain-containing protein [Gammaproteobacteria bacterium]|nr:CBS domain-containing protein [Gammaproteobacteria bacterium]
MKSPVLTIEPEQTASAAWSRMQDERVRHLVVVDGARPIGVLSDRDLGGTNGAEMRSGRTVRELMARKLATGTPGMTLRQAANLMRGRLIGSLPVVDDGRLVGIVTATDVLDELGRGSTRPEVTARRRGMRLPPASARDAARQDRL